MAKTATVRTVHHLHQTDSSQLLRTPYSNIHQMPSTDCCTYQWQIQILLRLRAICTINSLQTKVVTMGISIGMDKIQVKTKSNLLVNTHLLTSGYYLLGGHEQLSVHIQYLHITVRGWGRTQEGATITVRQGLQQTENLG